MSDARRRNRPLMPGMKPPNYNFFRRAIKDLQRLAADATAPADREQVLCEAERLLHAHCEGNALALCTAIESVDTERGRRAKEWATERFNAWASELRQKSDAHLEELVRIHAAEFGPFSESRIVEALESLTPGYARCFLYIAEKRRRDVSRLSKEVP